jgi:UDP:flavonoid glycosyltransferase YjiC (YdhE family)
VARIVYISIGMNSTVHGALECGRRLAAAGHELIFVSHRDISGQVEPAGFRFVDLRMDREYRRRHDETPAPPWSTANTGRLLSWYRQRRQLRRESCEEREIERTVAELTPDLLLIDIECHFAIIATAALNIPTALPTFFLCIYRRPGLPPLNTPLIPGTNWKERLRVGTAWWRLHLDATLQRSSESFSINGLKEKLWPVYQGTVRYPDLKRVARSRGYNLRRETDTRQWLRPMMHRYRPVISFNANELDFDHEPHPNLHFVGPMLNLRRPESNLDPVSAARWQAYKDSRSATATPRPLVYCALGSYLSPDRPFIERVLTVAGRRRDWDFVLGLGSLLPAETMGASQQNVVILNWAPQLEALAMADCALIHAGISTINECIYCEVPMVMHSTHTVDQDGNAARAAFRGLGLVADKATVTATTIERNIERAMSDPEIRLRLAAMRAEFIRYRETGALERVIEELLQ